MEFFDSNCCIGRARIKFHDSFHSVDGLTERMGRYGIERALVYHVVAREHHPATGNAQLLEEIEGRPQLLPAWVVLPHHTGEFPEPEVLIREMAENGVRAVRMFPAVGEQNFSVAEWSCGPLLSALERHRVPLFLGLDQISWDELYNLCRSHPDLNLVATDLNYRMDRRLYPLLAGFPRLFIESSNYKVHRGLEHLCQTFGAGRIIFGTAMPVLAGAGAATTIRYADLSDPDKAAIATGNLTALLEGVCYE